MKVIHLCIYVVLISIILGCQQNAAEENPEKQRSLGVPAQVEDSKNENNKSAEEIAEHLVHLSERVPEVKGATAIVLGDLAVIGVDVNENLDRSKVGVVKYEVAEALKHDPHGAYAFISADPDVNGRLKEMQKEIKAGHPIAGIMNELAAIVGRLIPVIPGAEHKADNPEPTDENNTKLNETKENKLEDIQEKQGKTEMDDNDNQQNGGRS